MVEAVTKILGDFRIAHGMCPIEQEVVIIEHVLPLLRLDIGAEELAQLAAQFTAPGKRFSKHLFEIHFSIYGARIDRQDKCLWSEIGFRVFEKPY